MDTTGAHWFAIWTRSRHEQVVREQLERKHIDAFLPTMPGGAGGRIGRRRSTGRCFPATASRASIPRTRCPILKCTGVVNIVSFDGKPAPIPEIELDSIRVLVGSDLQYDPCPMIHEGMMVEVIHGAAAWRHRPLDAEGRAEVAARAVGQFDRPGRQRRSRRRGRESVLTSNARTR